MGKWNILKLDSGTICRRANNIHVDFQVFPDLIFLKIMLRRRRLEMFFFPTTEDLDRAFTKSSTDRFAVQDRLIRDELIALRLPMPVRHVSCEPGPSSFFILDTPFLPGHFCKDSRTHPSQSDIWRYGSNSKVFAEAKIRLR